MISDFAMTDPGLMKFVMALMGLPQQSMVELGV
jgi:hypothetical protein